MTEAYLVADAGPGRDGRRAVAASDEPGCGWLGYGHAPQGNGPGAEDHVLGCETGESGDSLGYLGHGPQIFGVGVGRLDLDVEGPEAVDVEVGDVAIPVITEHDFTTRPHGHPEDARRHPNTRKITEAWAWASNEVKWRGRAGA